MADDNLSRTCSTSSMCAISPKTVTIGNPLWLRQRELDLQQRTIYPNGDQKYIFYRNLQSVGRLPAGCLAEKSGHGAIFGMNFSPDG